MARGILESQTPFQLKLSWKLLLRSVRWVSVLPPDSSFVRSPASLKFRLMSHRISAGDIYKHRRGGGPRLSDPAGTVVRLSMAPKKRSNRKTNKNEEENLIQRVCANKRERQRTKVSIPVPLLLPSFPLCLFLSPFPILAITWLSLLYPVLLYSPSSDHFRLIISSCVMGETTVGWLAGYSWLGPLSARKTDR